eukprot:TRINITY_DN5918_c0_g1_i1.p1 TRINITY_DN5918_c0_g1~~TRINITY_DN5918_c0_g1_i1.p1  ORF type:complete len:289 (-),score=60.63 TRINITY_DN5918_c0_g1_i1:49-915(-)
MVTTDLAHVFPVIRRLSSSRCVCAHRCGGGSFAPSNTLYGLRKSLAEAQPDMVEIDVQMTADGRLVAMHDPDVSQTTNGEGNVGEIAFDQLRSFDAAFTFTPDNGQTYPLRGEGIQVPTVQELLQELRQLKHLNVAVYFDVKSEAAVVPLFSLIEQERFGDRCIVGAYEYSTTQRILQHRPAHVPVAPDMWTMIKAYALWKLGLLWAMDIKFDVWGWWLMKDHWTSGMFTPAWMLALHRTGRIVLVFGEGIAAPDGMRLALDYGADVLLCDHPDVLRHTVDWFHKQNR